MWSSVRVKCFSGGVRIAFGTPLAISANTSAAVRASGDGYTRSVGSVGSGIGGLEQVVLGLDLGDHGVQVDAAVEVEGQLPEVDYDLSVDAAPADSDVLRADLRDRGGCDDRHDLRSLCRRRRSRASFRSECAALFVSGTGRGRAPWGHNR